MVVIDTGISTKENMEMLGAVHFDYICVSRSKLKDWATNLPPMEIRDKSDHLIEIRRVEVDGETDCFYHVKSYVKGLKEASIENRFTVSIRCTPSHNIFLSLLFLSTKKYVDIKAI